MRQHVSSLGDMTSWNQFPLLAGTPGFFWLLRGLEAQKGLCLVQGHRAVSMETTCEARVRWLLLRPQLPALLPVGASRE